MRNMEAVNHVFRVLSRRASEAKGDAFRGKAPVSFTWSLQAR